MEEFWRKAMCRVESPQNRQPRTVLIVDDDVEAVQFAQRVILAVCPHLSARCLESGAELISYVKGEHGFSDRAEFPYPVLILLDLTMTRMHGFEAMAWLKTHPPHNRIPLVVLTASGEMPVMRQAYALGASSFLTKPLKAAEFKDMMDAITKSAN